MKLDQSARPRLVDQAWPGQPHKFSVLPACKRLRGAFTLIELLIAIAVIAVLVMIVMAVMPQVTQRTQRMQCAVNLRTTYQGILAYTADNGGTLPGPTPGGQTYRYRTVDNALVVRTLANILAPYLAIAEPGDPRQWLTISSLQCPSTASLSDTDQHFGQFRTYYKGQLEDRPFGYGNQSAGMTEVPLVMNSIEKPSSIIALADRAGVGGNQEAHGRDRNVLFMDGHVESVAGTAFKSRAKESWEIVY